MELILEDFIEMGLDAYNPLEVKAGLDAAIVHASKIMPLFKIEPQDMAAAQRLIFNEWKDHQDPLLNFLIAKCNDNKNAAEKKYREKSSKWSSVLL